MIKKLTVKPWTKILLIANVESLEKRSNQLKLSNICKPEEG